MPEETHKWNGLPLTTCSREELKKAHEFISKEYAKSKVRAEEHAAYLAAVESELAQRT